MRIIQISSQKRNFRIFQVCAEAVQPDFSIYKKAQESNQIKWEELKQKDIQTLVNAADLVLAKKRTLYAIAVREMINRIGIPEYLRNFNDPDTTMEERDLINGANKWCSSILSMPTELRQKDMIKVRIAKLKGASDDTNIIVNLVSYQTKLINKMLEFLTIANQLQLESLLQTDGQITAQETVENNLIELQEEIITKANIQTPDSFFDLKTLTDWFMIAARNDKSYLRALDTELQKIAKVYSTNRLSTIKDEGTVKDNIASVIPAFSIVFKIVHELGIEQKKPEDIIRSALLSPIRNLEVFWPNWKSDIGNIAIPGKGVVGMLKSLYGKEAEQSGWLSKSQYIEIKLKFNETLTNLIKSATQYVCKTKQDTCSGFTNLIKNIDQPKFLYNVGEVSKCFQSETGSGPMFSPGSFDSARSLVKACTSFHPDVKINESKIINIVDTLLAKCVQWGQYKENKKHVEIFPETKGKDLPLNQYTFDPRIPENVHQNQTQVNSGNDTDDVSAKASSPTDTEQTADDTDPANASGSTTQSNNGSGWDNPETILFASQILFVLTQFSL